MTVKFGLSRAGWFTVQGSKVHGSRFELNPELRTLNPEP
jgi:hypothetical protein